MRWLAMSEWHGMLYTDGKPIERAFHRYLTSYSNTKTPASWPWGNIMPNRRYFPMAMKPASLRWHNKGLLAC